MLHVSAGKTGSPVEHVFVPLRVFLCCRSAGGSPTRGSPGVFGNCQCIVVVLLFVVVKLTLLFVSSKYLVKL